MPNPYVLLAGIIFAIGLFGSGVSIGVKWERRDTLANVVTAQNAAIAGANAAVALETERALARAKAESDARLANRTARMKGEVDAARKAKPECSRDPVSSGLLSDAIDTANGQSGSTAGVPVPMRPDAEAGKWFGLGRSDVGIPSR